MDSTMVQTMDRASATRRPSTSMDARPIKLVNFVLTVTLAGNQTLLLRTTLIRHLRSLVLMLGCPLQANPA